MLIPLLLTIYNFGYFTYHFFYSFHKDVFGDSGFESHYVYMSNHKAIGSILYVVVVLVLAWLHKCQT